MPTIVRTGHADAPLQVVWEVLSRSAEWASWSDFSSSVRLQEGEGHPDGVGSVRVLWIAGLVAAKEEVTTFKPEDGLYGYRVLSGVPVRDYVGRVQLTADASGTAIRWEASFRPLLPLPGAGTANGLALGLGVGRIVRALAAEAERRR